MNVDRRLADGSRVEEETVNKSQIYVTTAGWKNSFARLKRFVGEVKPREPQNEGVTEMLLTLKALKCVTMCQAAQQKVQRLSKAHIKYGSEQSRFKVKLLIPKREEFKYFWTILLYLFKQKNLLNIEKQIKENIIWIGKLLKKQLIMKYLLKEK